MRETQQSEIDISPPRSIDRGSPDEIDIASEEVGALDSNKLLHDSSGSFPGVAKPEDSKPDDSTAEAANKAFLELIEAEGSDVVKPTIDKITLPKDQISAEKLIRDLSKTFVPNAEYERISTIDSNEFVTRGRILFAFKVIDNKIVDISEKGGARYIVELIDRDLKYAELSGKLKRSIEVKQVTAGLICSLVEGAQPKPIILETPIAYNENKVSTNLLAVGDIVKSLEPAILKNAISDSNVTGIDIVSGAGSFGLILKVEQQKKWKYLNWLQKIISPPKISISMLCFVTTNDAKAPVRAHFVTLSLLVASPNSDVVVSRPSKPGFLPCDIPAHKIISAKRQTQSI